MNFQEPSEQGQIRELGTDEEPTAVIARDSKGNELARRSMRGYAPSPRGIPKPVGPYRTLIEIRTSPGFPMTFAVAPGSDGAVCTETRYRGAGAGGCNPNRLDDDAIQVGPAVWNENDDGKPVVLLEGSVGNAVSRLELHYRGGSVVEIPLVERYVLFEVPRALTPEELVGLGANGAVVARRRIR